MSWRATTRCVPTLLSVGFAEAVAYRAEMFVWVLTTTMPLVMLALWSAVAREAPIGRFGQSEFVLYFLATFVVRQLTSSWAAWLMNYEVRTGELSMRLLKPVHPLAVYAIQSVAALPLRLVVAVPTALIALALVGRHRISGDPVIWCVWVLAVAGAWLLNYLASVAIGCLSLFMESSLKVMDAWLASYFVLSGYLVPVELFPPWLRHLTAWLPFHYQLGFPVELVMGSYGRWQALAMLGRQLGFILLLLAITRALWRRGVRRFEAYGG